MQPDVLVIICDTARADAFRPWGGPYPTPAMERLAREGIVYSQATSQAPWTLPSTASIFSGKLPTEHGISGDCFEWTDGRPSSPGGAVRGFDGPWLPETFRERGYRTWGASCNIWISPWGGFDRGFDEFDHLHDKVRLPQGTVGNLLRKARRLYGKVDRGGRHAVEAFGRQYAAAGSRPLFGFVNLMECHAPYDPPRPFYPYAPWKRAQTRHLSGGSTKSRRFLSYNAGLVEPPRDYIRRVRELYYHSARYEDWLLGRFLQVVGDRGRPTVIAVVADHGENLGERGLFNHNSSMGQTLLRVPLVVWGPKVGVGDGRVEEPVSLLGLGEWLRAVADADGEPIRGGEPIVSEYESTVRHNGIPADILGMLDAGRSDRVPSLVYHPAVSVRDGRLKYVAVANGDESLHDVEDDPAEGRDLATARPEDLARFRPFRDAWLARRERRPTYETGDVAEDEIAAHLRTLGYID